MKEIYLAPCTGIMNESEMNQLDHNVQLKYISSWKKLK